MQHSSPKRLDSCLALLDHWENLPRAPGAVPNQAQIRPQTLKPILSNVFILDTNDEQAPHFVLAGTGLCEKFGQELRGERLLGYWDQSSLSELKGVLGTCLKQSRPAFFQSVAALDEVGVVEVLMLVAPLAFRSEAAVRLIGVVEVVNEFPRFNRGRILSMRLLTAHLVMAHTGDEVANHMLPRVAFR